MLSWALPSLGAGMRVGKVVCGTTTDYICSSAQYVNISVSSVTLLLAIFGEFDYEDMAVEQPILAPLYFFSWQFIVLVLLLNVFIAIVGEVYHDLGRNNASKRTMSIMELIRKKYEEARKKRVGSRMRKLRVLGGLAGRLGAAAKVQTKDDAHEALSEHESDQSEGEMAVSKTDFSQSLKETAGRPSKQPVALSVHTLDKPKVLSMVGDWR